MTDRRKSRIDDRIENGQKPLRCDCVESTHYAVGGEHRGSRRIERYAAGRQAGFVGAVETFKEIAVAVLEGLVRLVVGGRRRRRRYQIGRFWRMASEPP